MHNEELHNLFSSPNIIRMSKSRRARRAGHVAGMGKKQNAHRNLATTPGRNRPLGTPMHMWEYNIKMDVREIRQGNMDWIDLTQVGAGGRLL
jgi:hypothetical protein